jgi:hypothetical protein
MRFRNPLIVAISAAAFASLFAGCSTIAEKTNFISDDQIKSKVGGTLGYAPEAIQLVDRRTSGTDTYVTVRVQGKKEFACTLNGGNVLTAGIINPPTCHPKS